VGFEMRDGVATRSTGWQIVFNPSMPYRMTHMLLASGLTVRLPDRRALGLADPARRSEAGPAARAAHRAHLAAILAPAADRWSATCTV
jgi:hypothetical protein